MKENELRGLPHTVVPALAPGRAWREYPGSVTVEGDVTGVRLRARGHVIFMAECGNAEITTEQGSVFLMYGSGKSLLVHAGANIYVRNALQTTLAARGDIIIEDSALHSTLTAGGKIISEAEGGRLIGGECAAGTMVQVRAIGNAAEAGTLVSVTAPSGCIIAREIQPNALLRIGTVQHRVRAPVRGENFRRVYVDAGELVAAEVMRRTSAQGMTLTLGPPCRLR